MTVKRFDSSGGSGSMYFAPQGGPATSAASGRAFRLKVYRNRLRRWSWSARGMNGEKLAQGQSYSRRKDMLDTLATLHGLSPSALALLAAVGEVTVRNVATVRVASYGLTPESKGGPLL